MKKFDEISKENELNGLLINKINKELRYKVFPEVLSTINKKDNHLSKSLKTLYNLLAYNGCHSIDDFCNKISQCRPYQVKMILVSKAYLDFCSNYSEKVIIDKVKHLLLRYSDNANHLFLNHKDLTEKKIEYLYERNDKIFGQYEYIVDEDSDFFITNSDRIFYSNKFNKKTSYRQLGIQSENHVFDIIALADSSIYLRLENNNWITFGRYSDGTIDKYWEIDKVFKNRILTKKSFPFFSIGHGELGFFEIQDNIIKVGKITLTYIAKFFEDGDFKLDNDVVLKIHEFEDTNIFIFNLKSGVSIIFYNEFNKKHLERVKDNTKGLRFISIKYF